MNTLTIQPIKYIQLQLIERCNLKCPFCPNSYVEQTGNLMSEGLFDKILDDLDGYEGSLAFHLMNEPTLDDRLYDFIRKAKKKFPKNRLYISTNGTIIDDINKLFEAGITELSISCYNKGQLDKYRHLGCSKIKVHDFVNYKQMTNLYNRGGNIDFGGEGKGYCFRPFEVMCIKWNGKVVLCCSDYKNEAVMGDINDNTLEEVFNNDIYKKYREHLLQGKRDLPLCNKCNFK